MLADRWQDKWSPLNDVCLPPAPRHSIDSVQSGESLDGTQQSGTEKLIRDYEVLVEKDQALLNNPGSREGAIELAGKEALENFIQSQEKK